MEQAENNVMALEILIPPSREPFIEATAKSIKKWYVAEGKPTSEKLHLTINENIVNNQFDRSR